MLIRDSMPIEFRGKSAGLMQRQKERALFVGAIAGVPAGSTVWQPSRADWLSGPHAATLSAIEALALTTAGTGAAAQVSLGRFCPLLLCSA